MAKDFPKIRNADFDWNDLKFALMVARHGGLSQAAAQLGTSASTVSRHIQQLEKSLGQTLFLRQQSGYLLTDQGKDVLKLIDGVEQALLSLERQQSQPGQNISGLVRLACAEMSANYLIVPHLAALHQRFPLLQLELLVDVRLADLNRREADLAMRLVRAKEQIADPDYIGHCLGSMEFALFHSRQHTQSGAYINWGEDWSLLPVAQWMQQEYKPQMPVFCSNNAQAQISAARLGLGSIALPRFAGLAQPDLVEIPSKQTPLRREVWLFYHRDLKASLRVQALRDFLSEVLKPALLQAQKH
jgi:DNA-binding transcriptional LysR family regulator